MAVLDGHGGALFESIVLRWCPGNGTLGLKVLAVNFQALRIRLDSSALPACKEFRRVGATVASSASWTIML